MRNLKTIENRVLAVLKEHPEARNDDMKLYLLVSKACIYDTHGISHFGFEDVISARSFPFTTRAYRRSIYFAFGTSQRDIDN